MSAFSGIDSAEKEEAMVLRGNWRMWVGSGIAAALFIGCGGSKDQPGNSGETVTVANSGADGQGDSKNPAKPDKFHQPFEEAATFEVPADAAVALPPTLTLAGRNCGNLNEEVQKIWNTIKFTTAEGKRQTFIAELEVGNAKQEFGAIEILMQPDTAPNHVRNFVALAMLQFYDGLRFDRIVRQEGMSEDGKISKLVLLEAGSPVESADPATSHLGYWLRPEFSTQLKHEEGTVGACLIPAEDNAETAACRFYINLTPAPAMDGNFTAFGKITKGLEIARKIAEQPVVSAEPGPDQGRPAMPIVIRKVVVKPVPVIE
jgi:peptidyl-prolyl cis-trans isomerase B (cyclophilin B)